MGDFPKFGHICALQLLCNVLAHLIQVVEIMVTSFHSTTLQRYYNLCDSMWLPCGSNLFLQGFIMISTMTLV